MSKFDFYERVLTALGLAVVDVPTFIKHMGFTVQAYDKIKNGKTKSMSAKNMLKAARYLRVSPDWLATGVGEPRDRDVWPLSQDILLALHAADEDTKRRAENAARSVLDMEALPKAAEPARRSDKQLSAVA